MFIIAAIPISRGSAINELSYYSAIDYPVGSFVQVPVRGKERTAMVISSDKVSNVKAKLRSKEYALRKIKRQESAQLVTLEFINAVKKTALYHASTVGAVLFSTIPKSLLEQLEVSTERLGAVKPKLRGFIIPRLYQGLVQNRIDFYRSSIRETFAVHGSVFITTPTIADAERVYKELSTGIEKYSYLLNSSLSKKVQKTRIANILASEHPVLIVAPPSFLSVPRHDLTTIIVEKENSPLYRSRVRPFLDTRMLAYELAKQLGAQLFLADLPVRIDSIYKKEIGKYEEIVTGNHRTNFDTSANVISLQGTNSSLKKKFRAIDDELLESIRNVSERGERTFLYVARRGLSPVTLCRDCETVVTCDECGVSVVLHKGAEENYFLCHSCGALRHAREICKKCKSWRLEAFGIGTELVERELNEVFPDVKIFMISSDTTKTHVKTKKIMKEFYSTPGAVMIGTEMALPYLTKRVPLVGIVSLDSLLSLASWNIYERVASTLTRLREVSSEGLLLQTRRSEVDLLSTVISGNFSGFYRSELLARKNLGYPPFTVLIKVSVTGTEDGVKEKMNKAVEALLPYELVVFSRVLKTRGGKFSLHGFLRINKDNWPNEKLLRRLNSLSPRYVIEIDPDSIL